MGKVAIVLKVLPSSTEVDLNELGEKVVEVLRGKCQVLKIEKEPIGFGIDSLIFTLVRDEELGISDVEEKLKNVDGVGDVIVSSLTLI